MIPIGIIEDDDVIRNIIESYLNLQDEMCCTLSSDSIESFYENVDRNQLPKIMLCDIGLPGLNGIEGIRRIKTDFPDIEFIMLTIHDDSHKIFTALKAGASGYLVKNNSLDHIGSAIENVLSGGSPLSSQVARKVVEYFNPKKKYTLSFLEGEVVQGFIDGLSYKMIADKLNISLDGVRYHVKNIYKKLHVNSKAEVLQKSYNGDI